MSFEVFRRHQRKLLAVFAILAMFGFVVSDSLPRLLSSNATRPRPAGRQALRQDVHQSDLNEMADGAEPGQPFLSPASFPYIGPEPFGSLKTRDLVDALILQHEADRLGIPAGPEVGKDFLKQVTQGRMNGDTFELLMADFHNQVSGEQVLAAIANQVRLNYVRGMPRVPNRLLGAPMVTPYDIFRAYRDQNEKVSAKLVEVPVEQVPRQGPRALGARRSGRITTSTRTSCPTRSRSDPRLQGPPPGPGRDPLDRRQRPGPRHQGPAHRRRAPGRLREPQVGIRDPARRGDLPADLFAGQPELTPPVIRPFDEVRSDLASSLAEEKAQAEIVEQFDQDQGRRPRPVLRRVPGRARATRRRPAKQGLETTAALPQAHGPQGAWRSARGLDYELTPMLSREDAEQLSARSPAPRSGLARQRERGGRSSPTSSSIPRRASSSRSSSPTRWARGTSPARSRTSPPRVPPLDEVRPQVVLAWKMDKARPLAQKAADELAEQLKKKPGDVKDGTFQGYRVVTIPAIPRMQIAAGRVARSLREDDARGDADHRGCRPGRGVPQGVLLAPAGCGRRRGQPAARPCITRWGSSGGIPPPSPPSTPPTATSFASSRMAREQADRQLLEDWMASLRREAGVPPTGCPPTRPGRKSRRPQPGMITYLSRVGATHRDRPGSPRWVAPTRRVRLPGSATNAR